ncbi:hypothetical protein P3S67_014802 [Capsicum chacoense]
METLKILEPNLVGFSLLFSVIYFFGYFIIFKDWKEKVSSTLIGLVPAEITSPFQNTLELPGTEKSDTPMAAKLYEKLSPAFYMLYSLVRGILGPLFVYKMGLAFASGKADGVISSLCGFLEWL